MGVKTRKNLAGQTFGDLEVHSEAGVDSQGRVRWNCVCLCGRRSVVRGDNLRRGNTKSCGWCNGARFAPPPGSNRGHLPVGSDHHAWKGDEVQYGPLHHWLNLNFPKNGICEECGLDGPTDRAKKAGREYTRNPDDYRELCRTCHNRYDRRVRA